MRDFEIGKYSKQIVDINSSEGKAYMHKCNIRNVLFNSTNDIKLKMKLAMSICSRNKQKYNF